jgi:hypothetical protein
MKRHSCFSRHNTRQRDNFLHRHYKKSISNSIDKNIKNLECLYIDIKPYQHCLQY